MGKLRFLNFELKLRDRSSRKLLTQLSPQNDKYNKQAIDEPVKTAAVFVPSASAEFGTQHFFPRPSLSPALFAPLPFARNRPNSPPVRKTRLRVSVNGAAPTPRATMSQIAVWRGSKTRVFGYWHHGILCPDGTVIHYTMGTRRVRRAKQRAHIIRTSFEAFKFGATEVFDVHPKHKEKVLSPEEVVKRAESRMGEDNYNLVFNNCENFARWCCTGEDKSRQIGTHIKYVLRGFLPLGIAGALMGICLSSLKMSIVDRKTERLSLRHDEEPENADSGVESAAETTEQTAGAGESSAGSKQQASGTGENGVDGGEQTGGEQA